jgi:hypothetical protein
VAAGGSFDGQRADEEIAGAVEDAKQFERGYESEWIVFWKFRSEKQRRRRCEREWFRQPERAAWAEWRDDWIERRRGFWSWLRYSWLGSKSARESAAAGWRELRPWIAVEQ